MQAPVEICYAGVVIARSEEVREVKGGEIFVVMKDPLPVGTLVGLRSADSLVSVRVVHVVDSTTGQTAECGYGRRAQMMPRQPCGSRLRPRPNLPAPGRNRHASRRRRRIGV